MIMQKDELNNVNISDEQILITPKELKKYYPLDHNNQQIISQSRRIIADIIQHRDPRLLVICGPCSIHDVDVALEYAHRLKQLAIELSDSLYIVMRVYFEKPRTTTGWKGLISDPMMDGSFDMEKGLHIARKLLGTSKNSRFSINPWLSF
ncbi:3-deoxy-7-phosphoheptulonate synthase [Arsenophonus sp. ENCA]|nr:3-deoxy-7-phosphoheptulonate synthase [Arsenophonus sp. ENCA]